MGIDALFIADGVHGEEIGALTRNILAASLRASRACRRRAAMRTLVW